MAGQFPYAGGVCWGLPRRHGTGADSRLPAPGDGPPAARLSCVVSEGPGESPRPPSTFAARDGGS